MAYPDGNKSATYLAISARRASRANFLHLSSSPIKSAFPNFGEQHTGVRRAGDWKLLEIFIVLDDGEVDESTARAVISASPAPLVGSETPAGQGETSAVGKAGCKAGEDSSEAGSKALPKNTYKPQMVSSLSDREKVKRWMRLQLSDGARMGVGVALLEFPFLSFVEHVDRLSCMK